MAGGRRNGFLTLLTQAAATVAAGEEFAMTPKMTKTELRAYVECRARELAESGLHMNWLSIENELRFVEGIPEARDILAREWLRDTLDRLCLAAHRRNADARDGNLLPGRPK